MKPATLIALHGNLGRPEDWAGLPAPSDELHAPALWDWAERGWGFSEVAEHLLAEAEAVRQAGRSPWLAGYSLGGRLALHALALRPEVWSGAVILSAHPGLAVPAERASRVARDARWAERARHEPWDRFLESWDSQPVFGVDRSGELPGDAPDPRLGLESRREAVARAFELWSLGRQEDLRPALERCGTPMIWVTGAEDLAFSRLGEEMAGRLPCCRHLALPGLGHRLLEAPEQLASAFAQLRQG